MKALLNIIFRKKTLNFILFIITTAIIRESLALGFDENFEDLFLYLNEKYGNNNVQLYILILQIVLTKGSYITLSILFTILLVFAFLKYKELIIPVADKKELEELQNKISKIIDEKKYPEIYHELFRKITTKFSPGYSDYYLKDLSISINIRELKNNQIEFHQNTKCKMFTDKTQKYFKYKHPIIDQKQSGFSLKLDTYKIDGIAFESNPKNDFNSLETVIESKNPLTLEYSHTYKYSILENPYHLFKISTYCSSLSFQIYTPENIIVEYFDLGNNKIDFVRRNGYLRIDLREGVLPNDGFGIFYKKVID